MDVAEHKSKPTARQQTTTPRDEWDIENSRPLLNCLASMSETSIVRPNKATPSAILDLPYDFQAMSFAQLLINARLRALQEG